MIDERRQDRAHENGKDYAVGMCRIDDPHGRDEGTDDEPLDPAARIGRSGAGRIRRQEHGAECEAAEHHVPMHRQGRDPLPLAEQIAQGDHQREAQ